MCLNKYIFFFKKNADNVLGYFEKRKNAINNVNSSGDIIFLNKDIPRCFCVLTVLAVAPV